MVATLGPVEEERAENAVDRTLGRLRAIDSRPAPEDTGARPSPFPPGAVPDAPVPDGPEGPDGPPLTLADLYRDHRLRLMRLAMLLVDIPATAEDVVQEAFTGLHRHWTGLRDETAAVAYLRAAVVNGSRSVLRRRRTAREYVPPHSANARSAESLAMLSAEHQQVVDALSLLPPRQREVLVLRYYGGLTESEISEAAGMSRGTVKSTASRALDAIARIMEERAGAAARRGEAR
ncbi:RNA polymerase sigma-70 factor, sigma-E family [Pseudonocardia ammonioxydans]|uniref:RNA polymerase sigma-70 factor, sigma-E family n=1 Tax=Pseudonocardia ammonioxydans TaxID=260086 RepID=A0A1I4X7D8_PSUAM|nr:RNA polymerase sigma-70 factor, sigma-E family [Pseudonocardia ammonioxydans]